jgi:hypothetical protein
LLSDFVELAGFEVGAEEGFGVLVATEEGFGVLVASEDGFALLGLGLDVGLGVDGAGLGWTVGLGVKMEFGGWEGYSLTARTCKPCIFFSWLTFSRRSR